jgi:hypothetical protein
MALVLVLGVVAFFTLAALRGADSRPYDARARRWL